jgi:nicotinate phosphoribosyltransferase
MGVSEDAPALDIAYKLSEYGGEGRTKLSRHKPILPGRKQVFSREEDGKAVGDVISRAGEPLEGRPLLRNVMHSGRRVADAADDLLSVRRRAAEELARLPAHVTALQPAGPPYAVHISAALEKHHAHVRNTFRALSEQVEPRSAASDGKRA